MGGRGISTLGGASMLTGTALAGPRRPASTSPWRAPLRRLAAYGTRLRPDAALALMDALIAVLMMGGVLSLRFDGSVPDVFWRNFLVSAPIVSALTIVSNRGWRLYGRIWRHSSIPEARRLLASGLTVMVTLTALVVLGARILPLSVVVLGTVASTAGQGLVRFQARLFALGRRRAAVGMVDVVVLGAGSAGAALVRDMLGPRDGALRPVAVLDDDPRTHGRTVGGIPVVGSFAELPDVVSRTGAHQVVLAVGDPSPGVIRDVATLAERAQVPLRVLPSVSELVNGRVSVRDLRDLAIEDLLGRHQIETDLSAVRSLLHGRRVLLTGAGGSIGSEIARQVASFQPEVLLLLDHDETHLYDVVLGLPAECPSVQLLADIRDGDVVHRLMQQHRPEIVFHAAAHKHVPVLEQFPEEAVRTNCLGTANLVRSAAALGAERFILISTDKAVDPSSVMGASKRVAEQVVLANRPPGGSYCAVRFGNVLGSRGSVLPTFLRQIESGGPVTITDGRMTRYFMSIHEAVQLVLQAATMSAGGEVFILEMGEPVRILDLASKMIRLAGRTVGSDVEIRVTGMRPGEKLAEALHTDEEHLMATDHPSISMVHPRTPMPSALDADLARLEAHARTAHPGLRPELFGLARGDGRASAQPVLIDHQNATSPSWTIELVTGA